MSAGFEALGDDGVDPGGGCGLGLFGRADLDEDLHPVVVGGLHERRRITPEEHDGGDVHLTDGCDLIAIPDVVAGIGLVDDRVYAEWRLGQRPGLRNSS